MEEFVGLCWQPVNYHMCIGRAHFGLAVLKSGGLLAAGGVGDSNGVPLALCETFDGSTWTETGPMNQKR